MSKDAMPTSKAKTAYGLLSEVCALIIEEPKRYDQTFWLTREGHGDNVVTAEHGYPVCGTVGCIAGWVTTLAGRQPQNPYDCEERAAKILGLKTEQHLALFYASALTGSEPQTRAHARRGVCHIRKFQKKYRSQLLKTKVTHARHRSR